MGEGLVAAYLPPREFEPVGLSFVGASLASPGTMEALEHGLRKDHPLRALFLADRPDGGKPEWTNNMLLRHGVRSCLVAPSCDNNGGSDAVELPVPGHEALDPQLNRSRGAKTDIRLQVVNVGIRGRNVAWL